MRREFGYNWSLLLQVGLAVPVVVAYVVWRKGQIASPDVVCVLIALAGYTIYQVLPLCKVVLDESSVEVSFLLPIRRGGQFRHDQIDSYAQLAFTTRKKEKKAIAGFLKIKNGKRIVIAAVGTKCFDELSSALSELFGEPVNHAEYRNTAGRGRPEAMD